MLPLLPRPPPPRRAVGSRASRGAGKRGGGAGKGSEAGSVPEQTTAPTRGRARASVTGAREPGWKRRLCPGVRRSPWSPPHARLRSLLLPPSLPEKARLQARATRRQLQELAPYWAAAPRQLRTAPFAVFKGPRAPRPPRRPALRACAPGTVATGEGRRGRGLSLQAAGFRRGGRAGAPPQRGRTGILGRCPRMERSKEVSPSVYKSRNVTCEDLK